MRKPLIDYAQDRREEGAERWFDLQEALRRVAPRYYSVPQVVGDPGRDRFIVALSQNVTSDPAVEKAWLATCPPGRRFYKAFVPERHATLFQVDQETGQVNAEPLGKQLFYRRIGEVEFIIKAFEILFISTAVIQQREVNPDGSGLRKLYAKELLGCVTFGRIVEVDFSWTVEEARRRSEIHSYDQQPAYRLLKAIGVETDARFDPRGVEDLARWPD